MTIVKSFSVGNGDMFYIKHGSDSFSIIDCCLSNDRADDILGEIATAKRGKGILRAISTHPDQDHIRGLMRLDNRFELLNFYVVANEATKSEETDDFKRYKVLRDDGKKAYYFERGCSRHWLNESNDDRKSAGIRIQWPIRSSEAFKTALKKAKDGGSPNNISPVFRYARANGAKVMWMGDLETSFMEEISDDFTPGRAHVLFAPHHGRKSGRVPTAWLKAIQPTIIVVGEAPSSDLTYYGSYETITQNSAGDIVFECLKGKTRVYVSKPGYSVDFLTSEPGVGDNHGGYYIGTFNT